MDDGPVGGGGGGGGGEEGEEAGREEEAGEEHRDSRHPAVVMIVVVVAVVLVVMVVVSHDHCHRGRRMPGRPIGQVVVLFTLIYTCCNKLASSELPTYLVSTSKQSTVQHQLRLICLNSLSILVHTLCTTPC